MRTNARTPAGMVGARGALRVAFLQALLGAALLALSGVLEAGHAQQSGAFSSRARSAVLMEAETGAVLYVHDADVPAPPASMSKLMTVAMVFKALKAGRLQPGDEFEMSVNAWRTGGAPSRTSAMFVPVKTKATVEELLQGIIVQSGNDASISIAEGMAGSEQAFAVLMNEEARRIGLKGSVFRNATGLPHPEHVMTARDLAVLSRHLMHEYPDRYPMFAQKEFRYRKHRFINRNPLLFTDLGVDGLKTGHTKEAGYGMVVSARQEGRRLIAVVTGLPTSDDRKREATKLLEWGFKNFTDLKIFDTGEVVGQARVWGGTRLFVPLTGDGDVSVVLPRYPANQRLRAEIVYTGPLKPPIRKGDKVAMLRVTSSSGATNEVALMAAENVETGPLWRRGLDSLVHLAFRWLP